MAENQLDARLRLAERKRVLGISITDLAARTGLSRTTVTKALNSNAPVRNHIIEQLEAALTPPREKGLDALVRHFAEAQDELVELGREIASEFLQLKQDKIKLTEQQLLRKEEVLMRIGELRKSMAQIDSVLSVYAESLEKF